MHDKQNRYLRTNSIINNFLINNSQEGVFFPISEIFGIFYSEFVILHLYIELNPFL